MAAVLTASTSEAIGQNRELARAFYLRGREQFRLGNIEAAVEDLDRYVDLRPRVESSQWERGIAYYYAGLYKKGEQQFKLYQSYHDSDVENSVWRFLCMVPTSGIASARESMLEIRNDPRVPMMEIYDMYRGKLDPEDVFRAARQGDVSEQRLAGRLFYANLYVGLYYRAHGDKSAAGKFIALAADKKLQFHRGINRFMWDVARIHKQQYEQETAAP